MIVGIDYMLPITENQSEVRLNLPSPTNEIRFTPKVVQGKSFVVQRLRNATKSPLC